MALPLDDRVLTGNAALDAAGDGEVVRGFKRFLGDPTVFAVNGGPHSAAAFMAAQLRDILSVLTRAMDGPPAALMLTHPAMWGPEQLRAFAEAPLLAGADNVRFVTEPEAAATHYSVERRLGEGHLMGVYDLGGGTFDSTVLRMRAGGAEIIGTPRGIEHLGGLDFDEALLAHLNERLDGAIGEVARTNGHVSGFQSELRAKCVRAKEQLSHDEQVEVAVPLPSGTRQLTVTRTEFEDLIRPSIQRSVDELHKTIVSAGVEPSQVSAILLAGGSSRIPLVAKLVSEEFGKPVRATLNPKFAVALGAARLAVHYAAPRNHTAIIPPYPHDLPRRLTSRPPLPDYAQPPRFWPIALAIVAVILTIAVTLAAVLSDWF